MPAKIETMQDFINSKRFKNSTNNRSYTATEMLELENLFSHIKANNINVLGSMHNTIICLMTFEISNLVTRFDFLKQNLNKRTKETYNARYGNLEGEIRWNSYCEKQRVKNLFETKRQKYGWSKEQFDDFNKSRACTEKLMISRYGEIEGQKKWDHYVDVQRFTNTLEYYQQKYGKDVGYDKWIIYNNEKGKSNRLDWLMKKHNVSSEEAVEILAAKLPKSASSIAELTFISDLEQALGRNFKFSANTKQFSIWNTYTSRVCFYDIVDIETHKIIEFHGDYWHCNPMKYAGDYVNAHLQMSAKDIWQRDYTKTQCAIDRGFDVKIIWHSEYEKNKETIIKECIAL